MKIAISEALFAAWLAVLLATVITAIAFLASPQAHAQDDADTWVHCFADQPMTVRAIGGELHTLNSAGYWVPREWSTLVRLMAVLCPDQIEALLRARDASLAHVADNRRSRAIPPNVPTAFGRVSKRCPPYCKPGTKPGGTKPGTKPGGRPGTRPPPIVSKPPPVVKPPPVIDKPTTKPSPPIPLDVNNLIAVYPDHTVTQWRYRGNRWRVTFTDH